MFIGIELQPLSFSHLPAVLGMNIVSARKRLYNRIVVIQSIREFNRSVPFVPYEIQTASGERYAVPHPDFISVSPKGSFVIVIDSKERPHHLNSLLIERASLLKTASKDKNGRR